MFYPPVPESGIDESTDFQRHTAATRKKARAAGKRQSLLEIFLPRQPHLNDPSTCAKQDGR